MESTGLIWRAASVGRQPEQRPTGCLSSYQLTTDQQRDLKYAEDSAEARKSAGDLAVSIHRAAAEEERQLVSRTLALREELEAAESLVASLRTMLCQAETELDDHRTATAMRISGGADILHPESSQRQNQTIITADLIEILDDS